MLLILLAAAAQEPVPERFSILTPVAPQRCPPRARSSNENKEGDVVVCATDLPDQTLPLPLEAVPTGPRPSNPQLTGTGALAAEATPCAATQWGCQVGFGQPIVAAAVNGLVGLVKDAAARRPDKRGRVPIDISEPAKP